MQLRTLALSVILLAPLCAWCADAPPPMGVWTGKGQIGYVATHGNTEAKSANAALDLSLLEGDWKHALHLDGLYAQSADITSAQRWNAGWQSNYNFTSNLYTFGTLRYDRDLFSGFQYQASVAAGIGYKIFDTPGTKLSVQLGAGYRKERLESLIKDASGAVVQRVLGDSTSDGIASAGLDYSQALTSTTTLSDKLLVEAGSSNTLVTNALALTVKMSTKLALSVGYSLQNNSDPPPGLKKLDTIETVNLVFAL